MKRTSIALVSLGFLLLTVSSAHPRMLVRIHEPALDELPRGADIAGRRRGEWVDLVVEKEDLGEYLHLETEILIEDLESYHRTHKRDYHTYPELVAYLEAIAVSYWDIAMLDTIGTTWEGREILALKISDNVTVDEPEPEVLFVGLHHAREWPSLEICLFYIDTLTWVYGFDPHITRIVDSCEIWIVPCMNVDGYIYCHDEGHDWRRNRRYFPRFDTYGVDLNRNYGGANSGDPLGQWGSIPGVVSHSPSSEAYCGPSPFSESETQAVRDLILAHDFVFGITYHTYSECILWSWGYTRDPAEDWSIASSVGEEMASRITRQSGAGTYDAYQGAGLYPTTGDFDDWGYGFSLHVGGKNLLAYTVEACATYHPAASYMDQVVRENFDGALYICEVADSIADLLMPRVMPPEIAGLDTSHTGGYSVVWSQKNPAAHPDRYQLDELTGYSVARDDGESGSSLWATRHFTLSNVRSHSSDEAYFSNLSSGNKASALTSIWPLVVSTQDSLSFWCWYDIEEQRDYAYVEISVDGREWEILDAFTASSGGWLKKAYSLDAYVGNSIFIQFRYVTDDYEEREGFWVDDIYPVPSFDTIEVLDSALADTTYAILGMPSGDYYYRVKGYNDARGWGDWSQLRKVVATSISEVECPSGSPGAFYLSQNHPNPVRHSTTVHYYLPRRSTVELNIYDISGRLVRTLVEGEHTAGYYTATWDCTDRENRRTPAGVYFCRLAVRLVRADLAAGEIQAPRSVHTDLEVWRELGTHAGLAARESTLTRKMIVVR